jgi:hypothetical protein
MYSEYRPFVCDIFDHKKMILLWCLLIACVVVSSQEIHLPRTIDVFGIETHKTTSLWHLDRIDQEYGLDGRYYTTNEKGRNVDIYIVDTGINAIHSTFSGRVLYGVDTTTFNHSQTGAVDCNGHGTHVASLAAGTDYGVATEATIIPVRFMQCGNVGTFQSFSAAIQWTVKSIKSRNRRSVVNLSVESSSNNIIDQLVLALYEAGAVVVVAAGNAGADACDYSPARQQTILTVGAINKDDVKLGMSNAGKCVDIWAPGEQVTAASNRGFGTSTKTGTSMAAPIVAGIAATVWERFPEYTNEQLVAEIKRRSKRIRYCSIVNASVVQTLYASTRWKSVVPNTPGRLFFSWMPEWTPVASGGQICLELHGSVNDVVISTYPFNPYVASSRAPPVWFRVQTPLLSISDGRYSSYAVEPSFPMYVLRVNKTQIMLFDTDKNMLLSHAHNETLRRFRRMSLLNPNVHPCRDRNVNNRRLSCVEFDANQNISFTCGVNRVMITPERVVMNGRVIELYTKTPLWRYVKKVGLLQGPYWKKIADSLYCTSIETNNKFRKC